MFSIDVDAFKPVELWLKHRDRKKQFQRHKTAIRDCALNTLTIHLHKLAEFLLDPDIFKKRGVAYFYHKWIKTNPVLLVDPTIHPTFGTIGYPVGYWTTDKRIQLMRDIAAIKW